MVDPGVTPRPDDFVLFQFHSADAPLFRRYVDRGTDKAGAPVFDLVALNPAFRTETVNAEHAGILLGTVTEFRGFLRRT